MKNVHIVRTAVCLKDTCRADAMSNSEKIKPIALALLSYTCLKNQLVSQSVGHPVGP